MATLEHVNLTTQDTHATAAWLCEIFDWKIRWEGGSKNDGYSVHVGSDTSYVALYSPVGDTKPGIDNYTHLNGLNHIAVVVDDLDDTEARVKAAGFTPFSHGDYEPGRRFYFKDQNGLEVEVVNYA